MSSSYKKNTKDKNYKEKLNIKNEIKNFDDKLSFENDEELFEKLDLFLSNIEKSIIKKYIIFYIAEKLKQKEKIEKKLNRIRNTKNGEKKYKLKNELSNISKIISYLNKKLEAINLNRKIKVKNNEKESQNIKSSDNEEMSSSSINIKENIIMSLQNGMINIEEYKQNYEIYLESLMFYLRNYNLDEFYKMNISDSIELLYELEKEEKIEKSDVELYLNFIIDILKHKTVKVSKENQKLRKEYKRIKEKLELFLEFYKKDNKKEKHNYYYDILGILIKSPRNYYVIEKLLNEMKEFVNASKRIRIKKGYNNKESETYYLEHILVTIVDKYIENYKLELRGQTKDYVDKNYYKKLYYLFIKNPYLEIDKNVIHKMLNDFILSLDKANYLRNHKEEIIEEINFMINGVEKEEKANVNNNILDHIKHMKAKIQNAKTPNRIRMDKTYLKEMGELYQKILLEFGDISKEKLKQLQKILNISRRDRRNILFGCNTISCSKDHSYTISYYEDGSYSFRLNTLDLYSVIKDSPLEDYLLDSLDKQNKNILLNCKDLQIEEGKILPTITYEIRIHRNGSIGSLKVYKSITEVEKEYNSIDTYKQDKKLKELVSIYKILSLDNKPNLDIEIVDNYFKDFFSKLIIDYCNTRIKKIPIILKGKDILDEEYYMKLHYELCEIYSKLDRKSFERIYNILKMNLDQNHYSVLDDCFKGNYQIVLENNYVKYFNQKLISEYIRNIEFSIISIDEASNDEAKEVLEKANKGISYISDNKSIDKNKARVYHN